jgi:hypothetical protein
MRCVTAMSVLGSVLMVLGLIQGFSDHGVPLAAAQLHGIQAGELEYCSSPVGTNGACDECQSNGNGHYVKCSSMSTSSYCESNYSDPTLPSPTCENRNVSCGGIAITYENDDCTAYISHTTCYRVYGNPVTGTATGVNCNLN